MVPSALSSEEICPIDDVKVLEFCSSLSREITEIFFSKMLSRVFFVSLWFITNRRGPGEVAMRINQSKGVSGLQRMRIEGPLLGMLERPLVWMR